MLLLLANHSRMYSSIGGCHNEVVVGQEALHIIDDEAPLAVQHVLVELVRLTLCPSRLWLHKKAAGKLHYWLR